ncbi:MAG TPA: hypothetical protein PKY59_16720 [Pyrinomonadaceae bacterium]|nr:hypothetical protein [Pyrinomonadaceae bacterium]
MRRIRFATYPTVELTGFYGLVSPSPLPSSLAGGDLGDFWKNVLYSSTLTS